MSTSVRAQVAAILAPMIPNTWAVKPHTVKQLATLAQPTVYVEHTTIEPLTAAPYGHASNTVTVTALSHRKDYDRAEDALDSDVLLLLAALDANDRIAWTRAEKITVADTYLGWAITLTLITETEV
nr:hypothetical protein [Microbacterium bovistercoris]